MIDDLWLMTEDEEDAAGRERFLFDIACCLEEKLGSYVMKVGSFMFTSKKRDIY